MRVYDEKITITCDACDRKTKVDIPDGPDGSSVWVSELQKRGWIIILTSPVPFAGIDICNECVPSILDSFDEPIFNVHSIIVNKNKTASTTVLKHLLSQIASQYIVKHNKQRKENEANV